MLGPRPASILRYLAIAATVVLAAACGISNPYDSDGGSAGGTSEVIEALGLKLRVQPDDAPGTLTQSREAWRLVELALPGLLELEQSGELPGGAASGDDVGGVLWIPAGDRDTLMPPNPRGERIYSVRIILDAILNGGDALADIAFISRAEGDRLGAGGSDERRIASYRYRLDADTANRLMKLIYLP